jgi:hypothetical protein
MKIFVFIKGTDKLRLSVNSGHSPCIAKVLAHHIIFQEYNTSSWQDIVAHCALKRNIV